MKYKEIKKGFEVYYVFKGEEFFVGAINTGAEEVYVFEDILFSKDHKKINTDIKVLKDEIDLYYSEQDTIGALEKKHTYL